MIHSPRNCRHSYNSYNRAMVAVLLAVALHQPPADGGLGRILSRLSEEAEVLWRNAPHLLATETLRQKVLVAPPRFRPRAGEAALKPPPLQYRDREIVSEYSFSSLRDSPEVLHELRSVSTVDGKTVLSAKEARVALAAGVASEDDLRKLQMLRAFEQHTLAGHAVVDFGLVLLLFRKRSLPDYAFALERTSRIGSEPVTVLSFRQLRGEAALTIFARKQALRRPLDGEIWVRNWDLAPLRIVLRTVRSDEEREIRDEAVVSYEASPSGALVPTRVEHHQHADTVLVAEHLFEYSRFRRFSAETEIRFEPAPGEENPPPEKE